MRVKKGYLSLYFCYDVAEEIFVGKIEKIFGAVPEKLALKFSRLTPPYLQYREAPLFVNLGTQKVGNDTFICTAKVYDFGVITIRLSLQLVNLSDEQLLALSERYMNNTALEKVARQVLEKVKVEIKDAMNVGIASADAWEDYAIVSVHEFQQSMNGNDLLTKHKEWLAWLLKSEKKKLSVHEQADALKYFISYYENDLVVVDWNAAFVYDPQQGFEVLDVLEYAVIELLELRAYDALLDNVLDKAYDDLGHKRAHPTTVRTLSQVRLDVAGVIEKVENCLKLVGDLYLAKVYNTAAARFYLDRWKGSVKGKLDTIESMYTLLYDRIQTSRMMVLEVLIVLFFIIDLVLIFLEIFMIK